MIEIIIITFLIWLLTEAVLKKIVLDVNRNFKWLKLVKKHTNFEE